MFGNGNILFLEDLGEIVVHPHSTLWLKDITLQSNGFDIEVEFTAKVLRAGYIIKEMPITYKPRDYTEGKKITWKDGVQAVWLLLKYRIQKKSS